MDQSLCFNPMTFQEKAELLQKDLLCSTLSQHWVRGSCCLVTKDAPNFADCTELTDVSWSNGALFDLNAEWKAKRCYSPANAEESGLASENNWKRILQYKPLTGETIIFSVWLNKWKDTVKVVSGRLTREDKSKPELKICKETIWFRSKWNEESGGKTVQTQVCSVDCVFFCLFVLSLVWTLMRTKTNKSRCKYFTRCFRYAVVFIKFHVTQVFSRFTMKMYLFWCFSSTTCKS